MLERKKRKEEKKRERVVMKKLHNIAIAHSKWSSTIRNRSRNRRAVTTHAGAKSSDNHQQTHQSSRS